MNETVKLGLILLIITSIAALVLGFSNMVTSDKIVEAEEQVSEKARAEVLDADEFIEEAGMSEGFITEVFKAMKDDELVGYAIKSYSKNAYGGNIFVITGISMEGKVTGIKVVEHKETPGLGANAELPKFRNQYKGKSTENKLVVNKDIQALAGATITSNAVTEAVNYATEFFNEKLSK